jgi:hypothetical protein
MNHRVLLVEPYPDLPRVMTEMLVQAGYAVDHKTIAAKPIFYSTERVVTGTRR